jgi:hypothetical protein
MRKGIIPGQAQEIKANKWITYNIKKIKKHQCS